LIVCNFDLGLAFAARAEFHIRNTFVEAHAAALARLTEHAVEGLVALALAQFLFPFPIVGTLDIWPTIFAPVAGVEPDRCAAPSAVPASASLSIQVASVRA
jgi:hypothetical protein